jgi:hypothetical protein
MSGAIAENNNAAESRFGVGLGLVWLATIVFTAVGVWVYYKTSINQLPYKPGIGFGYYMGVVGGVMMLLMLLYPVRKHMRFARNWGPIRYWFMVHMVFGIGGPTLILFHSTFHIKSLNAGVAMVSMLLVAISGVVGRFIYKRIHHGLYGRKSSLEELQQAVIANQNKVSQVNATLAEVVGEQLKQFRSMAVTNQGSFIDRAWRFITLGWQRRKLAAHCHQQLRNAVERMAKEQSWSTQLQDQHFQEAVLNVDEYLDAVQQAAQFSSYEQMFRLWHILHSPFVWLLGISGIVHVLATKFMY